MSSLQLSEEETQWILALRTLGQEQRAIAGDMILNLAEAALSENSHPRRDTVVRLSQA